MSAELHIPDTLSQADGIWYAGEKATVSYHEAGHANCYQVEDQSFWFGHRNRCILEAFGNFPPPGTVLDVGGGNGFVTRMLQDNGYHTFLVEPGATGAANAHQRGVQHIICSTLEDAGFPPASVPAIGLFDVIEHIEDDEGMVRDLSGLMMPEGMLYITVPAYQFLWSYHDTNAGHYRRYTARSICRLLEQNGFDIVYHTCFFSLLVVPNFLLRAMPYRLGLVKKIDDLETKKKHHLSRQSLLNKIMNGIWEREARMIRKKKRIRVGNSILVVARKKPNE